ncbi:MAG: hypothetical protein IKE01_04685 [Clostridia bacterium]|nr:hypothetical protein [Clostridia bacterium]
MCLFEKKPILWYNEMIGMRVITKEVMKLEKKKTIRGIKRIAAVLSAGAMVLPLTACKAKNIFKEINIQSCIDKYETDFENGTTHNESVLYDYVADLYSKYEKHAQRFIGPVSDEHFEQYASAVRIQTNEEPMIVTVDDSNSYSVYTHNDKENKTFVCKYNLDGSYSIYEEKDGFAQKIEFDENGLLTSIENDRGKDNYELYRYKNGDMSVYDLYDKLGRIIERINEDGSHIEYKYNCSYKNIVNESFDRIELSYDRDGTLQNIDAFKEKEISQYGDYENVIEDTHAIYQLNGDSDAYVQYFNNVPDPEFSYLFDEDKIHMGTIVYQKIDDNVTIKMKDGIIYSYTPENGTIMEVIARGGGRSYKENCPAGCFIDACKVQDGGVMHYNEDGTKNYLENIAIGKMAFYDENGDIEFTRIDNNNLTSGRVLTEYYGDENSIVHSIENYSEEVITAKANGQDFVFGPNGVVSFYESGQVHIYNNTTNNPTKINVSDNEHIINAQE